MRELLSSAIAKLNAYWLSVVRTAASVVAGSVVAWLVGQKIDVPEGVGNALGLIVFGAGVIAWYMVARALEVLGAKGNLPWLVTVGGLMNGIPRPPAYESPPSTTQARTPPA
jgi:preprotein translocase subunit SecY